MRIAAAHNKSWWSFQKVFAVACLVLFSSRAAMARPPEEAEFYAAGSIGEDVASWIDGLEPRPNSVGVFFVHANAPLEDDYAAVVEAEILKQLATLKLQAVVSCSECRTSQVVVEGEKLIISRAAVDLETLKRIGKKQPVETFIVVEIYRTKITVLAQAILYQNPSGAVLAAERFRVPALNYSDSAAQVLITVGPGQVLQGKAGVERSITTAANLSLLEELGFGKGGLNLGAVPDSNSGTFLYLNPTYGFRGRFANSGLAWSLHLGVGYGFTPDARGISFRGAFDIYLGSLATLGFEMSHFLPDRTVETLRTYGGFHIGLSLGR